MASCVFLGWSGRTVGATVSLFFQAQYAYKTIVKYMYGSLCIKINR